MCPRQGSNFGVRITSLREVSEPPLRELLLAQEKVTKEKGTLVAGRPRADCSARLGL
jgi:hypothetical protein